MALIPYNTGKVKIGCAYIAKPATYTPDADMGALQTALITTKSTPRQSILESLIKYLLGDKP